MGAFKTKTYSIGVVGLSALLDKVHTPPSPDIPGELYKELIGYLLMYWELSSFIGSKYKPITLLRNLHTHAPGFPGELLCPGSSSLIGAKYKPITLLRNLHTHAPVFPGELLCPGPSSLIGAKYKPITLLRNLHTNAPSIPGELLCPGSSSLIGAKSELITSTLHFVANSIKRFSIKYYNLITISSVFQIIR